MVSSLEGLLLDLRTEMKQTNVKKKKQKQKTPGMGRLQVGPVALILYMYIRQHV